MDKVDFFPILRLLLPKCDQRVYHIKEKALASLYISALGLSVNSSDSENLVNYTKPQLNSGDFGEVLSGILSKHCHLSVIIHSLKSEQKQKTEVFEIVSMSKYLILMRSSMS
jgi:hypothetical protein